MAFWDVNHVLHCARFEESNNHHDKIFALCSVFGRLGIPVLYTNYTRPLLEVYTEAASTAIRHSGSLSLLTHVNGARPLSGLPSWVVDWSDDLPFFHPAMMRRGVPEVVKRSLPFIHIDVATKSLILRVKYVGKVLSCTSDIMEDAIVYPAWTGQGELALLFRRLHYLKIFKRWLDDAVPLETPRGLDVCLQGMFEVLDVYHRPDVSNYMSEHLDRFG